MGITVLNIKHIYQITKLLIPEINEVRMLTVYKNGREDRKGISLLTEKMVSKILKLNSKSPMKPNISAFLRLNFLIMSKTIMLLNPKPKKAKTPSTKANVESPLRL